VSEGVPPSNSPGRPGAHPWDPPWLCWMGGGRGRVEVEVEGEWVEVEVEGGGWWNEGGGGRVERGGGGGGGGGGGFLLYYIPLLFNLSRMSLMRDCWEATVASRLET
jgi:hypothetical protein